MKRAVAAVPTNPTNVMTTSTGRKEPPPVAMACTAIALTPTTMRPSSAITRADSDGPRIRREQ